MNVFEKTKKGIVLRVRVNPNSSSCGVGGIAEGPDGASFLKINLNVVPEKGKANKELIAFLASNLKIAKSGISIISGETDRYKKILFESGGQEVELKLCGWLGDLIDE